MTPLVELLTTQYGLSECESLDLAAHIDILVIRGLDDASIMRQAYLRAEILALIGSSHQSLYDRLRELGQARRRVSYD